jgi:hypothetical protein
VCYQVIAIDFDQSFVAALLDKRGAFRVRIALD